MPVARAGWWLFCLTIAVCAASALAAQTSPPGSESRYRIAGMVVSKTDGRFLARARVSIGNVKNQKEVFSVVTSDDGKFEFTGLAAGKYFLQGDKRGYLPGSYDQHEQYSTAIVTGAGIDTENLILRLPPAAYITGKVLDESGDPVRRATVNLYQINHNEGVGRIIGVRAVTTDDLGAYELGPQTPGTYFVSASAMPWYAMHGSSSEGSGNAPVGHVDSALDVAYALTYYGDVTDADSATPIQLRGGDRLQADIHLNPVQALHLYFHAANDPQRGVPFPQLVRSGLGGDEEMVQSYVQPVSPGLWEITGIPAGRYSVRIPGTDGNRSEIKQVDITNDRQELDTSGAEALGVVNISARVPGENTLPPQLAVGLRLPHANIKAWQMFDAKGEAHLQQVASGRHEVVVWNFGKAYSIAQISSSDAEISGHTINVPQGGTVSASLTLITGMGNVTGFAKLAGRAVAGAMVVLVPKDPTLNPDLFRRDQTDLDGSFQLNSVVPGAYTIMAIQDGWDLDWSEPASIAPYMKQGQTIEIPNQRSATLPQVLEVQTK
ncbi:MAG TPA: carboxypeptidase-like regulatory domain-containing protein [Terriglobales bacterium]